MSVISTAGEEESQGRAHEMGRGLTSCLDRQPQCLNLTEHLLFIKDTPDATSVWSSGQQRYSLIVATQGLQDSELVNGKESI